MPHEGENEGAGELLIRMEKKVDEIRVMIQLTQQG